MDLPELDVVGDGLSRRSSGFSWTLCVQIEEEKVSEYCAISNQWGTAKSVRASLLATMFEAMFRARRKPFRHTATTMCDLRYGTSALGVTATTCQPAHGV